MARVYEMEESKRTDTTAPTASHSSQVFNYVSLISVSANSHCSSRAIVPRNSTCHMHSAPSPSSNFLLLLLLLLRIRISDISIRFYSGSSPPFYVPQHPPKHPAVVTPHRPERTGKGIRRSCSEPWVWCSGCLLAGWCIEWCLVQLDANTLPRGPYCWQTLVRRRS